MLNDIPHNKGVLVFGNGLGGGIQNAKRADRYEGEFDSGFAHGMGQYTSTSSGKMYRGEFNAGLRHGCGVEYDMKPYLKRVQKGMDPEAAWREAEPEVERKAVRGTWVKNVFLTGPDETGRWCHIHEIRGTEQEVASVVAKARMFEFKPDGEVTFRFAQDASGLPAPVMQDPLHYPHGTKFLAPGPMGQCFPVPDDDGLKLKMAQAADTHRKIYQQYNLPYEVEPGSVMEKAQKLWKKKQARRQRALEKRLKREQQRIRRMDKVAEAAEAETRAQQQPEKKEAAPVAEEEDFDDDDLIASTIGVAEGQQSQQQPGGEQPTLPPSTFASVSLGLTRAAVMVQRAFHSAAVRAPARRSLTRPSRK